MGEGLRLGIYLGWAILEVAVGFLLSGVVAVLLAMLLVVRDVSPADRVAWSTGAAAAFAALAYLHLSLGITIPMVGTPVLFGVALAGSSWLGIGDAGHPLVQRLRLPVPGERP